MKKQLACLALVTSFSAIHGVAHANDEGTSSGNIRAVLTNLVPGDAVHTIEVKGLGSVNDCFNLARVSGSVNSSYYAFSNASCIDSHGHVVGAVACRSGQCVKIDVSPR